MQRRDFRQGHRKQLRMDIYAACSVALHGFGCELFIDVLHEEFFYKDGERLGTSQPWRRRPSPSRASAVPLCDGALQLPRPRAWWRSQMRRRWLASDVWPPG